MTETVLLLLNPEVDTTSDADKLVLNGNKLAVSEVQVNTISINPLLENRFSVDCSVNALWLAPVCFFYYLFL